MTNAVRACILAGEGTVGTWAQYKGKLTDRAIKTRLTKERCGGDRWARCAVIFSDGNAYDFDTGERVDCPQVCAWCGKAKQIIQCQHCGNAICHSCWNLVSPVAPFACPGCGVAVCGICQEKIESSTGKDHGQCCATQALRQMGRAGR